MSRSDALDRGFAAVHAWFRAFGAYGQARTLTNPELRARQQEEAETDARAAVDDYRASAKDFNSVEVIRGD